MPPIIWPSNRESWWHGDLPTGSYRLHADDRTWDIAVSPGIKREDLIFQVDSVRRVVDPQLPAIVRSELGKDTLSLQLTGVTKGTRVTLIGARYLHPANSWDALTPFSDQQRSYFKQSTATCAYLTDRKLDDEMRYIFDRRGATVFPGTLLPRPGLLVNRWTEQETTNKDAILNGGDEGRPQYSASAGGSGAADPFGGSGASTPAQDFSFIDFLATNSVVRYSLVPQADGTLRIPLADFRTSQMIHVLVTDGSLMSRTVVPLDPSEPPLRDLRLNRPLDPTKHHTGTRGSTFLATGGEITIDNMLDADWRAFNTLEDAWTYLAGATPESKYGLPDLAFLHHWSDLPEATKLAHLSESACHELHLFLYRKDRPFFDKFVKPRLAEKMEPTFIDNYLIERDLTSYLRPFAWEKLNAAEKALLARALPAARERIATELRQRWELDRPDADEENALFLATLRGEGLSESDSLGLARSQPAPVAGYVASGESSRNADQAGTSYLTSKLRSIVIPSINFEDTTIEEAIEYLRQRSVELDSTEVDPTRKGLNFIMPKRDFGSVRIKTLRLRNVPLAAALKYICDETRLRYRVEDYAVAIVPQTETGEDLFTRKFQVPPGFKGMLAVNDGATDPFSGERSELTTNSPITELLKRAGVLFPEGASATLSNNNTLLITNTPAELDKIQHLATPATLGATDAPVLGIVAESGIPNGLAGSPVLPPLPPPPVDPDTTRLWRESNYYKHSGSTDEEFIPINRFWVDLAAWDGKGPFVSPHFNECISNANEALMCLALLDLPQRAEKPEVRAESSKLHVKARSPMLLFYKDTRETDKVAKDAPVLVRETLLRLDESYRTVEGRQQQAAVEGNLVAGEHYGLSLVVTNPSGEERRVDVLAQIPAGAMPLKGLPVTLSKTVTLKPYGVASLDLAFYFPAAGSFTLYPLHVTEGDTVLAHAAERKLQVDAEAAAPDLQSWPVLARDGTNEQVLERLRRDNLHTLDLDAILWRLQDKAFFTTVTTLLRERLVFSPSISAYGFKHRDVAAMREFLENSEWTKQTGSWLDSPLLDIRPQTHLDFETLEFDPLANPRAHKFGENPRLSNSEAVDFQEKVLDLLAWKPALDDGDQLRLALLLQLQDRTGEAIERFNKIDPAKLPGRTAYDYLHAVLLFALQKPEDARTIAILYKEHPLALWRDRFAKVVAQADEIAGLAKGRPAAAPATAVLPSLEIASAPDGALQLKHRGLKSARLQLFHVDLEVLFSKDPFLKGGMDALPPIRANDTREVTLTDAGETRVELPEAFRHGNVLVAADTGTKQILQVLDSRAIELLRDPAERTVQALDASGKPLLKSYVKVYAEQRDGTITFLKDGYTDLRGKFDYFTHSFNPELRIKRVAVLVIHPEAGAKTMVFEP
ncbi:MAG: STN domain-containing protein [Luteolibacter sp.]